VYFELPRCYLGSVTKIIILTILKKSKWNKKYIIGAAFSEINFKKL